MVLVILAQLATHAPAAPPEVRGTYITTTNLYGSNGAVKDPATTTLTYSRLRGIGLNTVNMDIWRNGYTYFPSPTMQSTIGLAMEPSLGSRDLLGETLIQAHRNRMVQFGWMQYGFAAKFGNPGTSATELGKYMKDRNWLLTDSAGNYTNSSNGFSWMNPLVPQVRQLLTNVMVEAVRNYDLDGIVLDDRWAWPVQFGYDTITRDAYLLETGQNLPSNPNNAAFKRWRADKLKLYASELITTLKAVRPNLIIASAPAVYPFSYDNYCVDYPDWVNSGLFDEFAPQVYRSNFSDFNRDWDGPGSQTNGGQVQYFTNRMGDLNGLFSINTSSGVVPWAEIQQKLNLIRATPGVAGHSIWYSDGVLNSYLTQLTSYYNTGQLGHAERPDLPANWRPAPVVATRPGGTGDVWNTTVPALARYRVIRRVGDVWSIYLNTVLPPGAISFNIPGASQVELLLDRRGFRIGDANFDDIIDFDDYAIIDVGFLNGLSGWHNGDFDLNGVIDFDDYALIDAAYLGQGGPGTVIPEPSGIALAATALIGLMFRRRCHPARPNS